MFKANQDTNLQLAKEKRDREAKMKQDFNQAEQQEVHYTLNHDFMTENPMTEKSMLADHRVKPYHFKGLNQAQKAEILHERDQQIKEKAIADQNNKEAERLWALQ